MRKGNLRYLQPLKEAPPSHPQFIETPPPKTRKDHTLDFPRKFNVFDVNFDEKKLSVLAPSYTFSIFRHWIDFTFWVSS